MSSTAKDKRLAPATEEGSRGTIGDETGVVKGYAIADGTHAMLTHTESQVALRVAANASVRGLEIPGALLAKHQPFLISCCTSSSSETAACSIGLA